MRTIAVSDAEYAALEQLANELSTTPDAILAKLLSNPNSGRPHEAIIDLLSSSGFRESPESDDKYLALLAWLAARHAADFAEFIRSQSSPRFAAMDSEAVLATRRHNHARQINGTQYWAILNIPAATKVGFATRLLEFVGYHDLAIEYVRRALGGASKSSRAVPQVA